MAHDRNIAFEVLPSYLLVYVLKCLILVSCCSGLLIGVYFNLAHAETQSVPLKPSMPKASMCTDLQHALSQSQVSREQLSEYFIPAQRVQWRYRKARRLLFSKIAPHLVHGDVVIETLYTGRRARARHTKAPQGFNCEHLWPRAWMSAKRSRAYRKQESDLHNLYPSEMKVNSRRGHLPFGEVVKIKYFGASPSKIGHDFRGIEVIEVRDEYKGDVARSLLYMALRWRLDFPKDQRLAILEQWSKRDPPSKTEKRRNHHIESLQKNRNLLVDCPQLVDVLIAYLKRD